MASKKIAHPALEIPQHEWARFITNLNLKFSINPSQLPPTPLVPQPNARSVRGTVSSSRNSGRSCGRI